MCTSTLSKMADCHSWTTDQLGQTAILARISEDTSFKHNYFYGKQTFPTICHKIEVDIKIICVVPLHPLLKRVKHVFIPHKYCIG